MGFKEEPKLYLAWVICNKQWIARKNMYGDYNGVANVCLYLFSEALKAHVAK